MSLYKETTLSKALRANIPADDWGWDRQLNERAALELERLSELVTAKESLLVCYRLGKRPSGALLDRLAKLEP